MNSAPCSDIKVREFETGATRNGDSNKLDYEGFGHPSVELRYAEYMHKHRIQADGKLRDSANWQKGIPLSAYMKSLFRHFMDVWMWHRTGKTISGEDIQDAMCAVKFNIQGMMFEILKDKK